MQAWDLSRSDRTCELVITMFHVEHEQLKIQKRCSTGDNVPRGTFFYGNLKEEVLYCRKDAKKYAV